MKSTPAWLLPVVLAGGLALIYVLRDINGVQSFKIIQKWAESVDINQTYVL
jgi:hypothetical protein